MAVGNAVVHAFGGPTIERAGFGLPIIGAPTEERRDSDDRGTRLVLRFPRAS